MPMCVLYIIDGACTAVYVANKYIWGSPALSLLHLLILPSIALRIFLFFCTAEEYRWRRRVYISRLKSWCTHGTRSPGYRSVSWVIPNIEEFSSRQSSRYSDAIFQCLFFPSLPPSSSSSSSIFSLSLSLSSPFASYTTIICILYLFLFIFLFSLITWSLYKFIMLLDFWKKKSIRRHFHKLRPRFCFFFFPLSRGLFFFPPPSVWWSRSSSCGARLARMGGFHRIEYTYKISF